jgi:hypothetical protein
LNRHAATAASYGVSLLISQAFPQLIKIVSPRWIARNRETHRGRATLGNNERNLSGRPRQTKSQSAIHHSRIGGNREFPGSRGICPRVDVNCEPALIASRRNDECDRKNSSRGKIDKTGKIAREKLLTIRVTIASKNDDE